MELDLITREMWRAKNPTNPFEDLELPTKYLFIHHSVTPGGPGASLIRGIQEYHQNSEEFGGRGWKDIGYNFLIDDQGKVYEGRGAGIVGGATRDYNQVSHAICLLGNFEVGPPTQEALGSLIKLIKWGMNKGLWGSLILGHKDVKPDTQCCGYYLYNLLPDIRRELLFQHAIRLREDQMLIFDCPERPALLFVNGTWCELNKPRRDFLRARGIPKELISKEEHDIVRSFPKAG